MCKVTWSCAAWAAVVVALGAAGAREARGSIPPYQLVGQFAAPSSGAAFDVMPDGRVLFMAGNQVMAADVRVVGSTLALGSVPSSAVSSFGASFVSVSPDGTRLAFGDNNFGSGASVHFVTLANLSLSGPTATSAVVSPNQEAVWVGNSTLFVTGFAAGPVVTRIDAVGLTARTVIDGVGDGSGGVTCDGARLFVGLGFDGAGGARTGQVRAFDIAAVEGAVSPIGFSGGTLVARALSGNSLGFDAVGSLLVGGGDFFSGSGDFGSAAVVDGVSVVSALGGGAIDPVSAQLRLSPAGAGAFYSIKFNGATGELLVGDGSTIFRYAVPVPGAVGVLLMGSLFAGRRRRHE